VIIRAAKLLYQRANDVSGLYNVPPSGLIAAYVRLFSSHLPRRKPLIAGGQWPLWGVGTPCCLHCDLVYVAEEAKLRLPFR